LKRPDGAEIHWEARGEGPLVVLAGQAIGYPEIFQNLLDELASDHRVVTYHLRGQGESSPDGPYDPITDADDLVAVIEEAAGGPAVIIGMADGAHRAVRASARAPELVAGVVTPNGNPLGRDAVLRDSEGLAGSEAVVEAIMEMFSNDYRGALRRIITDANPQATEEEIRDRVAFTSQFSTQGPALERLQAWIADSTEEESKALGDRLWILQHPGNPWFTLDVLPKTRELLPEAHVEAVDDGPISRPDIAAGAVRQMTARIDVEAATA
jgi:pimeloyl-ACP methyl ester carboxylesterase